MKLLGGLRPDTSPAVIWTRPTETRKLSHRPHCGLPFCMPGKLSSITSFAFKMFGFPFNIPFFTTEAVCIYKQQHTDLGGPGDQESRWDLGNRREAIIRSPKCWLADLTPV